jgi:hypothetical protein
MIFILQGQQGLELIPTLCGLIQCNYTHYFKIRFSKLIINVSQAFEPRIPHIQNRSNAFKFFLPTNALFIKHKNVKTYN